jgi:hypothetical protein
MARTSSLSQVQAGLKEQLAAACWAPIPWPFHARIRWLLHISEEMTAISTRLVQTTHMCDGSYGSNSGPAACMPIPSPGSLIEHHRVLTVASTDCLS